MDVAVRQAYPCLPEGIRADIEKEALVYFRDVYYPRFCEKAGWAVV
jgi:hypothetical protein